MLIKFHVYSLSFYSHTQIHIRVLKSSLQIQELLLFYMHNIKADCST